MSKEIKAIDKRRIPVYIDSELDDSGLDPCTIRIYLRLARRASGNGQSWESVKNMAIGCRMSPATVKRSLRNLIDTRLIARISRPGATSIYQLNDKSCWEITQHENLPGSSESHLPGSSESHLPGSSESHLPGSSESHLPGSSESHKGIPIEVTPIEVTPIEVNTPLTPFGGTAPHGADLEQKNAVEFGAIEPPLATARSNPLSTLDSKKARSSAAVQRAKKSILSGVAKAKHEPDKFEAWWLVFRGHCRKANCRPGDRPVISWDALHEIAIASGTPSADLADRILEGTEAYWQRERLRNSPSVKNGCRFLEKRDWEEALEWRDFYQHSSAIAIGKNFTPFLTCFNQDRPAAWPAVEEGDIDADTILQLERLISSCQNSLERFQKALLWVKRDEYWGLQRVLTFKEFLYSTKISEWSKKQLHHESLGIQNTVGGLAQAAKKHAQDMRFQKICQELDQDARQRQTANH